jgi:hypothetical protein
MKDTILFLEVHITHLKTQALNERQAGQHFIATKKEKVIKNLNRLIKLARLIYPN